MLFSSWGRCAEEGVYCSVFLGSSYFLRSPVSRLLIRAPWVYTGGGALEFQVDLDFLRLPEDETLEGRGSAPSLIQTLGQRISKQIANP